MLAITTLVTATVRRQTIGNDVWLRIYTRCKWETKFMITIKRRMVGTVISFINFDISPRRVQQWISLRRTVCFHGYFKIASLP